MGFFHPHEQVVAAFEADRPRAYSAGLGNSARMDAPSSWGSYYETDPKVCAGNRDSLTTRFAARRRLVANA